MDRYSGGLGVSGDMHGVTIHLRQQAGFMLDLHNLQG